MNGLPADGDVVETRSDSGYEQDLLFDKGQWFQPNVSAAVIYTPKLWRKKNAE